MNLRSSFFNFWRASRTLIGIADPEDPDMAVPVSEAAPLPVRVIGGVPGGSAAPAPVSLEVVATYAPDFFVAGPEERGLSPWPDGVNRALVTVLSGTCRIGLGNAPVAPTYAVGEGVEIGGAQLAALRLIQDGSQPASVRVDRWRVEPVVIAPVQEDFQ